MSAPLAGLGLAALASVALNASYLMQHHGSRAAPRLSVRRPLGSARALLSSPWWVAGGAAGLIGWALFVAALARAPLSLTQMFAAAGLILTAPASALALHKPLTRAQTMAVVGLASSLAVLVAGSAEPLATAVPSLPLLVALGAVLVLAPALVLASPPARRAGALGGAGGLLYGAADAAMKAVTVDAHGSLGGAIASPWLAAVAAFSVAAFACFQRGLQLGPPVPVIALMTAGTSAAAVAIGLLAFGEPLGASPAIAALHLIAFLCAGAAAVALMIAQERPILEPGARSAAPNTSSRALARLS